MSSAPLSRIPPGHTSFTWFGAAAGTEQARSAGTAAAGATLSSASQDELRIVTSRLPASHTASTWFTGRLRQLRKELEERVSAAVVATSTVRSNYALESDIPDGVARVKASLELSQAKGAVLWSVDSSYYTWSLSERASLLGCSTSALCKAILMENKGATDFSDAASGGAAPSAGEKAGKGPKGSKGGPASGAGAASGESSAATASGPDYGARFMLVVVQYEAKIDDARLAKQLRAAAEQAAARGDARADAALRGPLGPGCNFQVAKEPDNDRLTGFPHNAVSPVATSSPLQVVLPLALVEGLPARTGERACWLGGGHVDTKLRLPLSELARSGGGLLGGKGAPPPLVLDYTEPLGEENDE